jgi:hypothetical protein
VEPDAGVELLEVVAPEDGVGTDAGVELLEVVAPEDGVGTDAGVELLEVVATEDGVEIDAAVPPQPVKTTRVMIARRSGARALRKAEVRIMGITAIRACWTQPNLSSFGRLLG